MASAKEMCRQIHTVCPEAGLCGREVSVFRERETGYWRVDMERRGRRLATRIDGEDAVACVERGKCFGVGVMLHLLMDNMERMH